MEDNIKTFEDVLAKALQLQEELGNQRLVASVIRVPKKYLPLWPMKHVGVPTMHGMTLKFWEEVYFQAETDLAYGRFVVG